MDITDAARLEILQGDGDSAETPIVFEGCHVRVRTLAEWLYLTRRFGDGDSDWTEEMHYTSADGHSVWTLRLKDGARRSVYFDTANTTYE